jgi:hypothetical protein
VNNFGDWDGSGRFFACASGRSCAVIDGDGQANLAFEIVLGAIRVGVDTLKRLHRSRHESTGFGVNFCLVDWRAAQGHLSLESASHKGKIR